MIHLGYEVGTGRPVEIPLAHTFVTGQTQLSGKTTTLQALVGRSGKRALAFVTKRGEQFDGRRIPPYLPREGEQPIHWRLVETILASALGQRSLKYERLWIVNAAKGAKSLADVRSNVDRLKAKAKGSTADVYLLIGEYLDLVLPEMRNLAAADVLDLQPGLNVMDLGGVGAQLQALVIRAALERINQHEHGVLTVFPEAWEFAPRARSAPAKDEAIAMARKGAVLGNYLLCDSQDIAGVDTVIRQAASVWILGVQRELNELKRTIESIPAGIARPKSAEVATLGLGQFYACWGRHAVKTYVQPSWMDSETARRVAVGAAAPPQPPKREETMSKEVEAKLDKLTDLFTQFVTRGQAAQAAVDRAAPRTNHVPTAAAAVAAKPEPEDFEALYQAIKTRLIAELPSDPTLLQVVCSRPELLVHVERQIISVDGSSLRGRIARLIVDGFFAEEAARTTAHVHAELAKRGGRDAMPGVSNELNELARLGFFTKDNKWWRLVPSMKVNVVEK